MCAERANLEAQQLYGLLPPRERERINNTLKQNALNRDQERYSCLETAEMRKQALLQELDTIDYDVAENDEWFVNAKENRLDVTTEALVLHRQKARDLYSRKRIIIDELLPTAESHLQSIISQISIEEQQEISFQQRELG